MASELEPKYFIIQNAAFMFDRCSLDAIPALGAEENPVSADGLRPDMIFKVGKLSPVEESPLNFGFSAWFYFIHSFSYSYLILGN